MSVKVWIDGRTVGNGLSDLYIRQQLCDISLICSDGQLFAHRLVLSSVSELFRELISSTIHCCHNTSVILPIHSLADIKLIVDSIYLGQQTIDEKRLNQLIVLAQELGIHLVTTMSSSMDTSDHQLVASVPPTLQTINDEEPLDLSVKRVVMSERVGPTLRANRVNDSIEVYGRRKQSVPKKIIETKFWKQLSDNSLKEGLDETLSNGLSDTKPNIEVMDVLAPDSSGKQMDNTCDDIEVNAGYETVPSEPTVCLICDKEFGTSRKLVRHLNADHKEDGKFKCNLCSKVQKYAKSFIQHLNDCNKKN